ncbi:hypothetical protein [Acuticoccus sp.]|uniref:hypothetical protein n=1 Tax=Acuticoccus sp. TaxID=1904378 RepID=UPI003B5175B6
MNTNFSYIPQGNVNHSDHDSPAAAMASGGGDQVVGGLIAANLLNPQTATAAGVNLSPVTQANVGSDIDALFDADAELLSPSDIMA